MKRTHIIASLGALSALLAAALLVNDRQPGQSPDTATTQNEVSNATNPAQPGELSAEDRNTLDDNTVNEAPTPEQQALAVMSESQKEKYQNIPDEDRAEMIEVVTATSQSSQAVAEGAERYFELVEDDQRFEQLDAEAEASIAQLKKQVEAREQGAQAAAPSTPASN